MFIADHFDKNNQEILDSDGIRIVKDLKTVKGLIARFRRNPNTAFAARASYVKIYKVNPFEIYDRQKYTWLLDLNK